MEQDLLNFTFSDDVNPNHCLPLDQSPLSVEDIEQLLFEDDDDDQLNFVDDILLDSPLEEVGEVVDHVSEDQNKNNVEEEKDNPDAKKRKRQLRNRDAAVRSRERKKMHVKDLELKSRYYEDECRRLGSLLQWYMAENQALRFSLHTSTSITKQESAVLLLESLLLGSLLWLMVVLLLPHRQSQMVAVSVVEEEKHLLPSLPAPSKTQFKCLVGKQFKASRPRMSSRSFKFQNTNPKPKLPPPAAAHQPSPPPFVDHQLRRSSTTNSAVRRPPPSSWIRSLLTISKLT